MVDSETEKLTRHEFDGFLGPDRRKCTDVLWLLLYLLLWLGSFSLLATAASRAGGTQGYRRLVGGTQIDGRICGLGGGDGAGEAYDRAFFFETTLYENKEATQRLEVGSSSDWILCLTSCPSVPPSSAAVGECAHGVVTGFLHPTEGEPFAVHACAYDSKSVYWNYCEPTEAARQGDDAAVASAQAYFDAFVAENEYALAVVELATKESALLFLVAVLASVLASVVYILLMRHCAALMTWVVVLLSVVFGMLAGYFLWFKATDSEELSEMVGDQDPDTYKGMAAVIWSITAVFLLVVVCSYRRINLAIRVVQEGTHATLQMPTIFLAPLMKTLALVGMLCYWCLGCVYIMSGSKLETTGTITMDGVTVPIRSPVWDDELRYAAVYHFFVLLWGTAFIVALGQLVLSLAVTRWYFTADVDGVRDVPSPLFSSLYMALRFHAGTVAFGSLLVAVVQFFRAALEFVDRRIKSAGADNKVVKIVVCLTRCCMWCLEKCIRFVNKQAYIATAIFGTSFCGSAVKAVGLMVRNFGRVGALNLIGGVIELIGSVFVTAFVSFLSYAMLIKVEYFSEQISDPIFPAVVAGIIAFTIAYLFMGVFGHAADVLLLCFIADEEMNNGQAEFAPHSLGSTVDAHGSGTEAEGGAGGGTLGYKPHSQM